VPCRAQRRVRQLVGQHLFRQPARQRRARQPRVQPPAEERDFLHLGRGPYDTLDKYSVCIMLANEQGSSDSTGGYANLRDTKVYNNVLAGCRIASATTPRARAPAPTTAEGHPRRQQHDRGAAHRFRNSEATGLLLSDNGSRTKARPS
jgi:hypothetical protein